MARQTAFSRQVALFNEQLVGEPRRQALIALAKSTLAEVSAQNEAVLGHAIEHETIVDGRPGATEEQVKASGGVIVYLFEVGAVSLENAVDEAFRILAQLSPVRSGKYQRSFRLFVNGQERDFATEGSEIALKPTDEIQITNLQPYARKIERGWSAQAPNGVVEAAVTSIRARYGNVLNVRFAYDRYPGFEIGTGRDGSGLHPSRVKDFDRAARYPTMYLTTR
jgi:hypothetical protein